VTGVQTCALPISRTGRIGDGKIFVVNGSEPLEF
jgi:nitrogen regulatory protein PII